MIPGSLSRGALAALLSPRDYGCSSSTPSDKLPTVPKLAALIRTQDPVAYEGIDVRQGKAAVTSSWSTVAVELRASSDVEELVSLIEFRLQSFWAIAHTASGMATALGGESGHGPRLHAMEHVLHHAKGATTQRLGANSPRDAQTLLDNLVATSDLEKEFEAAASKLKYAILNDQLSKDQANAVSNRLLELFSLIFAGSGLASLMLPLPVTADVIRDNTPEFLAWAAVVGAGAALVLLKRR